MGGGTIVLSPFLSRPSQACTDARAANRPDADEICQNDHGSGHGSGGHGSWNGPSASGSSSTEETHGTTGSKTTVERGGFGSTGFHFFHFGG